MNDTASRMTAGGSAMIAPIGLPEPTTVETLNRRAAYNRDRAQLNHLDAIQKHRETQADLLNELTAYALRAEPVELLNSLADKRGLAWSQIARLVGVSVPAVRKWRQGGSVSSEKRRRVAELSAFFDLLDKLPVGDAASWLESSFSGGETMLTGLDIYQTQNGPLALLEFAGQRISLHEMLDQQLPGWRRDHAHDGLKVVRMADGHLSIVEDH